MKHHSPKYFPRNSKKLSMARPKFKTWAEIVVNSYLSKIFKHFLPIYQKTFGNPTYTIK